MPSNTFTAPDIVPFMRYSDALAGIEWLNRVLGFETLTLYEGPGGSVAHAVLRFGSGALQISSPRGNEVARPDHTMGLGGLYLVVDDPDAFYVRAKAAGGDIVRELTDEEYGSREFSVRDPEGNVWSLGTYRPGSS